MKHLFKVFLFILFGCQAWSQSRAPIKSISADGTSLSKFWKWKEGDNAEWAAPSFNDSTWRDSPVLYKNISHFPELREAQIGWFRKPLRVDSSLTKKTLFLSIEQMGASEIYLDGKLLHKIGVVSTDPAVEKTKVLAELLPITLPDTLQHVLAIRYSFTKRNFYFPGTGQELFKIRLHDINRWGGSFYRDDLEMSRALAFCIGVFFIFSLLHFLFYSTNRQQKVSLSLGFTLLLFGISFFADFLDDHITTISGHEINELITLITLYLGLLLINVSLYLYLDQPFKYFFYLQAGLMVLALTSTIFDITLPFETQTWPFFVLLFVDFIRVSILADRRRHPNAKVPVNTLIAMAVCIVVFFVVSILFGMLAYNIDSVQSTSEYFLVVLGILALIFVLSIPVGLSLSLVKEYTRTHRSLLKKITEIEELSARNLAQEQEKQHLLSTQNELLEKQVATRTSELKKSLLSLKAAQAQLVQSEKLASLGELTAGIAHEIQNPLNFVNNFSEVSTELIDEMKEELERGDTEEVKAIAEDLQKNLQKIAHHGKRASSIVKGMLEHSRMGTGERQLTDINALCDEYLRLSYHGMRAKDKSFNAEFELITEPDLPRISVVSQDVGRVLLNLINNAFYAVNVTRASSPSFKPKVSVLTEKSDNQLIIKVKDNGAGMSDKVKAKIFQPFFTTKPTGQGTGLGLSLAYDIITKGHGGKIEVESAEGNGTTFTIRLPITTAPIAVS